uniref:Uncharacterized protein n=1 Tax=Rhizophora mucronata TaxID=61149 RepID=A0A2P2QWF6_RHIMU
MQHKELDLKTPESQYLGIVFLEKRGKMALVGQPD